MVLGTKEIEMDIQPGLLYHQRNYPTRCIDWPSVWDNELEFSSWLSQNLHVLHFRRDTTLTLQKAEQEVGPFRSDIFAVDSQTGDLVVIENQMTRSNHTHLGQIITYAAGLNARYVIWVAPKFTKEHLNAIKWLNTLSSGKVRFLAASFSIKCIREKDLNNSIAIPSFHYLIAG